jgi:RNA polymerase sigma factor (sigma-70 family)
MARPLTKTKTDGSSYVRPNSIEASIEQALQEDPDSLVRRARIPQRASPGFMPLECLVHLIREGRRRGDTKTMNALLNVLFERCEAILNSKITVDDVENAEEVREEILGDFSVLFAEDETEFDRSNRLDFFECRFNRAFLTFRIPYIERGREHSETIRPMPQERGDPDHQSDDDILSYVAEAFRTPANQENYVLQNAVRRAVRALPVDEQRAVVLRYFYGLPEESEKPSVTSVASVCGVTGRTIRYRLERALAKLSRQLDDKGRLRHDVTQQSGAAERRAL